MRPVKNIKERIGRYRYGKMILEQYGFRTMILGLCSSAVNLAFAIFNLVGSVVFGSLWYGAFAGYYAALIAFRVAVILGDAKARKKHEGNEKEYALRQNKIELAGGAYLVVIEIAMGIIITQTVIFGRPVKSGEIMAIATAAYAFYKIIMAIINLVRAKNHGDPVVQSLRNLNFADACMTMVSLTVILLTTFQNGESTTFNIAMEATVGFSACAIVLALATIMIIKSANRIKKIRQEENQPS